MMASIISNARTLTDASPRSRRAKANGPVDSTIGWSGTGSTTPASAPGTTNVS